jgi:hypothetical protein
LATLAGQEGTARFTGTILTDDNTLRKASMLRGKTKQNNTLQSTFKQFQKNEQTQMR